MARIFDTDKSRILDQVQVNIPFSWLMDPQADWMTIFIENRLNPEIGLDSGTLDQYSRREFAETARRFHSAERTITLHGPFLDLSPGAPDSAIRSVTRKRFSQMIEAAEVFCPRAVVCHAGYDPTRYSFTREAWYDNAAETWKWTARELADRQIPLMLENVYETEPEQLLRLFERTGTDNIGCCLDFGHLTVFSPIPLQNWLTILAPYIGQIHLHDNQGRSDQHLGMGKGDIDFSPILEWLGRISHKPVITLEPHDPDALAHSLQFLENCTLFR